MTKQKEIKFRIWDKKKKKMFYQDNQGWTGNNGFISLVEIYTGYENSDEWKNYEVMQFTGLLDRDGKEIYEGDIIDIGGVKRQVLYNQGDFVTTRQHKEPYSYLDLWQDSIVCKVIGNVFENPKLLVNNKND